MHSASQVVIRRATQQDLPGILRCLQQAFEPYRQNYTPGAFADTVLTAETLEARSQKMTIFVAQTPDGKIVGTIACQQENAEEGHLRGMAVLPAWHGAKVGQKLLDAAEAQLRVFGCRKATLDTTKPLERAISFYRRNGYVPTGSSKDFFGMPLYDYEKTL